MDFDFPLLKQEIKMAAMQAFTELLERCQEERIISFALYSDEGAMTVCPAFNTEAHLDGILAEEKEEGLYFKYEPAEWKFEAEGAEAAFDEICTKLRGFSLTEDEDDRFVAFRETLYETCIEVLEELVQADFFAQAAGRGIIVLFAVSDYDYEKEWYLRMIRRLNSAEAVLKECEAYVAGWSE